MAINYGDVGAGVATGGLYNVGKATGLLGKKATPIDITAQLQQIQNTYAQNRGLNQNLTGALNPLTAQYKTDLASAISGAKTDQTNQNNQYIANTDANTKEAQDALRKNLYASTFNGTPAALQAIREASAAGGGLNTGSYGKAVSNYGRGVGEQLAQGETSLQAQGAQARQGAQENAFNTFSNLSSKLSDQQINGLTKVMDTGREDLVRQYTTEMGLNEDETNAVVSLLNFQQSGQIAGQTAADANQTALLAALAGGGAKALGSR